MGPFATAKAIKKTIRPVPSFDTSVLQRVISPRQPGWWWLSGCICHGCPAASCHLKVTSVSVPLEACPGRRCSQILPSREIGRPTEVGLMVQSCRFPGFVAVFSFLLVCCRPCREGERQPPAFPLFVLSCSLLPVFLCCPVEMEEAVGFSGSGIRCMH